MWGWTRFSEKKTKKALRPMCTKKWNPKCPNIKMQPVWDFLFVSNHITIKKMKQSNICQKILFFAKRGSWHRLRFCVFKTFRTYLSVGTILYGQKCPMSVRIFIKEKTKTLNYRVCLSTKQCSHDENHISNRCV